MLKVKNGTTVNDAAQQYGISPKNNLHMAEESN